MTLSVGEERAGVDFQLQLVRTAKVEGSVQSNDSTLPQGTHISLISVDQVGMPALPGVSNNMTRAGADGRFVFCRLTQSRQIGRRIRPRLRRQ